MLKVNNCINGFVAGTPASFKLITHCSALTWDLSDLWDTGDTSVTL